MDQKQHQAMNTSEQALFDYKHGMGTFSTHLPDVAHHFSKFTEACFAEGTLSQKEKQLIALGISVVAQDEYCMIYHTKGCLDHGASYEEMMEACGVSAAFGGGAALSQAVTLVQESIHELQENKH
ncbi:carboxymuconolactone decarboxylase family protein [Pontibacillus yanchengensis]|uniref:Carboxymuconolactone decarboxylase family protein n=2 Tax=Pontibacillus yanchengensis TaxID=462910 RepID=A0ACC7VKS6_9BACI|nr:carboxymuconolactone decarboxylase family protein [Pontibacillus yanchengensis]MYL33720.1 carboxymuconolactone decarboxylase family protein [Pontibacillus yanchengensis]MYL55382.1 carboxymuconolactone decarboxylase family protein [Pontibacillus yanchengensis]